MELIYYRDPRGNFGDDLNPFFFGRVCTNYKAVNKKHLIGIGTLLNESRGLIEDSIIFGSGYGQGRPPQIDFSSTVVLGVRGPITAKSIGVEHAKIIGDPGMFLPHIAEFNSGKSLAPGMCVVGLHHRSAELWGFPSQQSRQIFFLDPAGHSLEDYIATIRDAKIVLAESMHSAIVAAAYNVPFIRIDLLNKTDATKWADFFLSIGIYEPTPPIPLPPPPQPIKRRIRLALARRGLIGEDVYKQAQQLPSGILDTMLDHVVNRTRGVKPILADRQKVMELQQKCADAIYKLNRLSGN
jgi:succinoglycan biosynthesis protein ExoV